MKLLNVILAGPAEKEKTALIKAFSDVVFKSPEQVAIGKKGDAYTVEFGRSKIGSDTYLYLAGVPMDEHFDFLWERLAKGLLGFILIVDMAATADKAAAKDLIARVKEMSQTPMVVVFIGPTGPRDPGVAALRKELDIAKEEQLICGAAADKQTAKAAISKLLQLGIKMQKKVTA